MYPKNNKKTLKKSMIGFLESKKRKLRKTIWEYRSGLSEYEVFDEGIKALAKIPSLLDDFEFIKKLIQLEQSFQSSPNLSHLGFSKYRSLVNPLLLAYVEIEIQVDCLEQKVHKLVHRDHDLASSEIKWLVLNLRDLNKWFFQDKRITYDNYQFRVFELINQSKQILDQHHGCKKILSNLILLILTLGTAFIVNKAVNGHFLFFQKTNSSKQLDKLNQTISQLSL